jgi:hypothetical protein
VEYWDRRGISEYPSGIVPHSGSYMARWNAYIADINGFGAADDLGYLGPGAAGIKIPSGAMNPILTFWKYNSCEYLGDTANDLKVRITDSTGLKQDHVVVERCDSSKAENQWVQYVFDLSAFGAGSTDFRGTTIYPMFTGTLDGSATSHLDILIDDVAIQWQCTGDTLSVSSAFSPAAIKHLTYTGYAPILGGSGAFTLTVNSRPDWSTVTLDGTRIKITGTPTSAGPDLVNVTVEDGCQAVQNFDIAVQVQPFPCSNYNTTLDPAGGSLPTGFTTVAYTQNFIINSTVPTATSWKLSPVQSGSIPSGLNFSAMGPSPATLVGSPDYPGTFSFQVTVEDNEGCIYGPFGPYSLEVRGSCPAGLSLTGGALPGGTEGQSYTTSQSLTVGATLDTSVYPFTFTVTSGTLPDGLTLTRNADGKSFTIAGKPIDGTAGSYAFDVTAVDYWGNCTATASYTLTVAPFDCGWGVISPPTLPQGTVGGPYSVVLTASGPPPHTFEKIGGDLPPGLSLNATTGEISGVPTTPGTYTFQVRARDNFTCPAEKEYSISVDCPGIVVDPPALLDGIVGFPYSRALSATGGNAPYTYTRVAGALPPGLGLVGDTISGTPTVEGTWDFTIRVTDAYGCSVNKPYSLRVNCPAITLSPSTLPSGLVNVWYDQTLAAAGGTAPYSFSLTAGHLPTGLNLLGTGRILGTPTDDGAFSFTIRATDAYGCSGQAGYNVSIGCPTISIGPASLPSGTVGTSYTATLTVTGGTAPHTFAVSSGSLPDGLDLLSNGTITGVPLASGTFNFTVVVADSLGCTSSRAYTVVISCPTISLSPASLPAGTTGHAYSQTITASGGTAPYTFQVTSGNLPAGLSLAANGTLSGTPAVTSVGSYSFTVRATDANGCSGTKNYTLQINPGWAPVSISSITKVAGTGFKLDINGSGFQPGVVVKIGSEVWPNVHYKSSSQLRLKGTGLRALFPKGVPVTVTVTNPDGGTASYTYTR